MMAAVTSGKVMGQWHFCLPEKGFAKKLGGY